MPGYARHTQTRELVAIREVDTPDGPEIEMVRQDGSTGRFPGVWRMVIAEDVRSATEAQRKALRDVPPEQIHGSAEDPKLPLLREAQRLGRLMEAELTVEPRPDRVIP